MRRMSQTLGVRIPWPAALVLFVGSLVPGLVALLPLAMGASWYLADDGNARFLTPARVWYELVMFSVAVAPFLAAVVAFVSVLVVRRDWTKAFLVAGAWAGALGFVAFIAAAASAGGF